MKLLLWTSDDDDDDDDDDGGQPIDTTGLVVENVTCLTTLENPRTTSWKVTVPFRYREMMEKDELYPAGWTHRKFFGPRRTGKDKNPNKVPRTEDAVEVALAQRQQEMEAKQKQLEDQEKKIREHQERLQKEEETLHQRNQHLEAVRVEMEKTKSNRAASLEVTNLGVGQSTI